MPNYEQLKVTEESRKNVALYLHSEITKSRNAFSGIKKTWDLILKLYEQLDVPEKKDTPFEGAANIMIPVMATYVEQVHSRLMDTLHSPKDPYTVAPTQQHLHKYAKALRRFLTWASDNELCEEKTDYASLLTLLKLGTMAQKVVYEKQTKTIQVWNETLKKHEPKVETMKDNPEFVALNLEDVFWQANVRTLEESGWKAHRFDLSWNDIKIRVDEGIYKKEWVEKIRNWYSSNRASGDVSNTETVQSQAGVEPSLLDRFELYEVYFEYPIELDPSEQPIDEMQNMDTPLGVLPTALQAVLHLDSQELVRLSYNTLPLGHDPIEVAPYIGREDMVHGIGVGHMALPFQIEITAMHNQRLDAGTVANAPAYLYQADSRVPSQLPLRPGHGIPVDDVEKDIKTFHLGTKYDSTLQEEQHTATILQERIGVKEIALDDLALSRAPATTTLAMMQEKGRRLDGVLRTLRRFKKRMMLKALLYYQAYYPKEKFIAILGEEDGKLLAEFFASVSPQTIWDCVGLEVAAITSATSRELERQSKMALFNVIVGYYDKYTSYIMASENPQLPTFIRLVAKKMADGLSAFIDELLEQFNSHSRSDFLIAYDETKAEALQIDQQQQAALGSGAQGAGAPVPEQGVQAPPPEGGQAAPA